MIHDTWFPFASYGFTAPFYGIYLETLFHVIIASALLILCALVIKWFIVNKPESVFSLCVCKVCFDIHQGIKSTIGQVNKTIFNFITTLFLIIMFFNLLSLIPHLEEPTKDVNVTFALAIVSFFYTHYIAYSIQKKSYWDHWFKTPLSLNTYSIITVPYLRRVEYIIKFFLNIIIALVLLPFELFGRLSTVLSLSFRLFGNIFGGATVSALAQGFFAQSWIYHCLGIVTGLSTLILGFFGCFEGLIQAFIFTVITLNNIGMLLGDDNH
jgi:F-type H+-transporting ATPase subunit a